MEDTPTVSSAADVMDSIRSQTEYYFSDGNLAADQFLRNLILRDKDGYVPIKTIANFNRMKSLTTDMQVIITALKASSELEVSGDDARVRRRTPMPEFNNQTSHRRTLVVEKLPEAATNDWLRVVFGNYGKVIRVRIYQPGSVDTWPRWLKNSNFNHEIESSFGLVEFGTEEESARAKAAVQSAAPGSEEAGLRASWVQMKKNQNQGGSNQGGNQQNRQQQQTEKRQKQRANGNTDASTQGTSGGDSGNGPSTSNGAKRGSQHDVDHPPGFQPYGPPQGPQAGRNQGNNANPRGNIRGGNQNFGGPSSSGVSHMHHPAMDPSVPGIIPPIAAPPGTFIAAPPGAFAVPHGAMMYPQPMMHPGAAGYQPMMHPGPAAMAPRLALVPLPAMMPLTAGSTTSGTPRQLSARAKSTPRSGNNANANTGTQRPRSTGRQPGSDQDAVQPGAAAEQAVQPQGNVRQQQRGSAEHQQQQQQQQPKKGNSNNPRVLVVPAVNDRQARQQHPQPQPHPGLNHLHANQSHSSPNRAHPHQQPHNSANHPQGPNQARRRGAATTANNAAVGADGAQIAPQAENGHDPAGGPSAGHTPDGAPKGKKQKAKKGKAKAGVDGEEGGEDPPGSGGKPGHQKRGNQHKHDKQQHHAADGQAEGGADEDGQEWGKRRPRKDYASWAAATPDFRLQAVAKSGTAKAGPAHPPSVPEHLHKDGSQRVPRMPDGTKGFTMGRGKPLTAGQPDGSGAFIPAPSTSAAGAADTGTAQPTAAGPVAVPSTSADAEPGNPVQASVEGAADVTQADAEPGNPVRASVEEDAADVAKVDAETVAVVAQLVAVDALVRPDDAVGTAAQPDDPVDAEQSTRTEPTAVHSSLPADGSPVDAAQPGSTQPVVVDASVLGDGLPVDAAQRDSAEPKDNEPLSAAAAERADTTQLHTSESEGSSLVPEAESTGAPGLLEAGLPEEGDAASQTPGDEGHSETTITAETTADSSQSTLTDAADSTTAQDTGASETSSSVQISCDAVDAHTAAADKVVPISAASDKVNPISDEPNTTSSGVEITDTTLSPALGELTSEVSSN